MTLISIHPDIDARIGAHVRNHDAWSPASGDCYPAKTLGHVTIGEVSLTVTVEQVAELRDLLTAALAEHESQAAPAA